MHNAENNSRYLKLISEISASLFDLNSVEAIFQYVTEKIFDFSGDCIIILNEYVEKENALLTKNIQGVPVITKKLSSVLGMDIIGKEYPIKKSSKIFKTFTSNSLIEIDGAIHKFFFNDINSRKCAKTKQELNVSEMLLCNLYKEDVLFGNLIMIFRNEQEVSRFMIETFARIASLALSSVQTKNIMTQSLSKYEKVLDNMAEGVMTNSADGTITYINKSLSHTSGYSKEELVGKNISFLMPGKVEKENVNKIIELRKKNISNTYQVQIKNKIGDVISLMVSGTPLKDSEGKIIGSIGVSRNITHKKKTTALKRELEIIKRTTEHKQQFLSNMSHEMLTPLNGIVGVLDMLEKSDFTDDQKELVNIIHQSSNHLLYLINNILEVSKLDRSQNAIDTKNFWVYDMINKQIELFSASAKKMSLFVEIKPSQNIDFLVETDELKISQIVSNLLGNAIKFNKKGGEITIGANVVNTANDQKILMFDIWDTGVGIAEEKISSVFERFSQADSSISRAYDGMGLGLSISKQIVEILGGRIEVESTEGKGSHFWFKVPVKLKKTKVLDKKKYHYLKKRYPVALIIDSKQTNQKILSLILSGHNIKSESVINGNQALEKFDPNKHSIIFCDPYLPDIDIYTLKIKIQQKYGATPPFIALAGKNELTNIIDYKANFMDDFLAKPYREKIFKSLLDKWII
ncbi:MAG: ATP-binding protein [Bacteroidota bacterium]